MVTKNVIINSPLGLHARPATILVNVVKDYECKVFIINGTKKANAGSIINLLTLGAKQGVELTVECDGADEQKALDEVVEFLATMKD